MANKKGTSNIQIAVRRMYELPLFSFRPSFLYKLVDPLLHGGVSE